MKQSKTSIGRPQLTLPLAWGLWPSRARPCVVRRLSKGFGNPTNGWPTREERRTLLNKNTQGDNLTHSQRDLVPCLFPRMHHLGGRAHLKNGSSSKSDPKIPLENILTCVCSYIIIYIYIYYHHTVQVAQVSVQVSYVYTPSAYMDYMH